MASRVKSRKKPPAPAEKKAPTQAEGKQPTRAERKPLPQSDRRPKAGSGGASPPAPAATWRYWLGAGAFVVLLLLASNHRLLSGSAVAIFDADQLSAAMNMLAGDLARAGQLVTWDPWTAAGSPTYIVPDAGAYSPLMFPLLFVAGGTLGGFFFIWLFYWVLGALGFLLLARQLGAPWWGGLVVGLGYMYSGFYTGHAEHTGYLFGMSALPFIVWRLDVALTERRWWPAVEAGCLWGLSALGGGIPLTVFSGIFCALWTLGRALGGTEEPAAAPAAAAAASADWRRRLLFGGLALVVVCAVGLAVQGSSLATFLYEAQGYSDRASALSRERAVTENALHPGTLVTFASPFLPMLKLPFSRQLWDYTDLSMVSVYAGVVIPVFAVLALAGSWRRRAWLAIVAAFCLACAMSQALPLRGWLYDLLLPMRYFRHSAMFRGYFIFALAVLALYGMKDLRGALAGTGPGIGSTRLRLLASAVGVAVLAAICFQSTLAQASAWVVQGLPSLLRMRTDSAPDGLDVAAAQIQFWLLWGAMAVVAVLPFLFTARWCAWAMPIGLIGLATLDGFLTVQASVPILYYSAPGYREAWDRIAREHVASFDLTARGLSRDVKSPDWTEPRKYLNTKNLPLRIPVLYSYQPLKNRFHEGAMQSRELTGYAVGPDRVWFSPAPAEVGVSDAGFAALVERSKALGTPPLLLHRPDDMLNAAAPQAIGPTDDEDRRRIAAAPAAQRLPVRVVSYKPEELAFSVEAPQAGWLLVTDRWARSWTAAVNGQATPVWGGNFIYRAVPVPAGTSEVRFSYHPPGGVWAIALPWAVVIAVLAGTIFTAWRARGTFGRARTTVVSEGEA